LTERFRALEVIKGLPFLHPNQSPLYCRQRDTPGASLLRLLGIHADSPYSFLAAAEAMNAVAAALV